jgi:hypothetical protein
VTHTAPLLLALRYVVTVIADELSRSFLPALPNDERLAAAAVGDLQQATFAGLRTSTSQKIEICRLQMADELSGT